MVYEDGDLGLVGLERIDMINSLRNVVVWHADMLGLY